MKRFLLVPLTAATALATGGFEEESIPPLSLYLGYDRLPKKSLLEISREVQPVPTKDVDFARELRAFADALKGGKTPKDLLPTIDTLLVAERARTNRVGPSLNALLHDFRDLCRSGADAAAAADYAQWRLAHTQQLGYALENNEEVFRSPWSDPEKPAEELVKDLEARAAAATPAVQPHYLYAHAAMVFRGSDDEESQRRFAAIAEKFPDHPRAEAALYMAGRCLARQSRKHEDEGYKNVEEKVAATRAAMNAYLQKYPQGAFAGDVLGWLGWLETNHEQYAAALSYFVKQLDVPGHPEYAVGATKEIESCFRHLHEDPEALGAALTDARVAQAAVYFASNEIEPVDDNGEYESAEFVASWRKKLFPALATALAGKPELFKAPGWQPRYVAALAMAASGSGNQNKALKLLEAVEPLASDDVALARAVVLQRAKRSGEAADAFQELAKKFPNSPLAPSARVREALALIDDHRSGEAALVLMALLERKPPAKTAAAADLPQEVLEQTEVTYEGIPRSHPKVEPADPAQIRQLLDTVLNFGPLPELTSAARENAGAEVHRVRLREIIAVRHLARERFAEAQPFMTPAQWQLVAEPLAQLTASAQAAQTPADKAATAMKVADAWAAARGKLLTVPLDTEEWRRAVYVDDHHLASFRRLDNGAALGFSGVNALDLENRDELRHAFNWWITASDAQPRTPLAATAVWRALRAMRDIAEVSPFTLDRAASKKWSEVSRKLCERLEKEHPNAPETKRYAVWWTFPPGKSEDGQPNYRGEAVALLEEADAGEEQTPEEEVKGRVGKILNAKTAPLDTLRKQVAAGRKWAQSTLTSLPAQCVVNFFEDLDLFLATPDLPPEVVQRYLELRYDTLASSAIGYGIFEPRAGTERKDAPGTVRDDEVLLAEIRAAIGDPKFAKITDFLGFLEIAVTANHWVSISYKGAPVNKDGSEPVYWGRDYVALEKLCRAWLEKYPQSRKREAAMLLHCRALRHAMSPHIYHRRVAWPVASRWEGANVPEEIPRLKFDAKVWKAALDRYDKEFPKGAYADDVLGYRADLGVRMKDWKRALQITLAQMQGKDHLHPGAENRLRVIFSSLAKDEDRADLLAAIRTVGGARGALIEELKSLENQSNHPLVPLREWLEEEAQQ